MKLRSLAVSSIRTSMVCFLQTQSARLWLSAGMPPVASFCPANRSCVAVARDVGPELGDAAAVAPDALWSRSCRRAGQAEAEEVVGVVACDRPGVADPGAGELVRERAC